MCRFIPSRFLFYMYTEANKIPFVKNLVNGAIKKIIPSQVNIAEGVLLLNKRDAVVSGAVALGVYERFEVDLFRQYIKQGMKVVDIGANIGYYTVIAAQRVGSDGVVYAFEPEPENFSFLEQSIQINNFKHVECFRVGISNRKGQEKLFLSKDNKGDHRMYSNGKDNQPSTAIEVTSLDVWHAERGLGKIDVIKMDIQGAEGLALDGMRNILQNTQPLVLFTEFWPQGLRDTGFDPRTILENFERYGFSIFEINEDKRSLIKVLDFDRLLREHKGRKYTNLLCEK